MADKNISYWLMESGIPVTESDYKKFEKSIHTNKEEKKEKDKNSLLNYECDEDDDGIDWET